MARRLTYVAGELEAGRTPQEWEVLKERPPFRKVKVHPLRAMARAVDGSVLVWLIRERDDFYKRIRRVNPRLDPSEFSELPVATRARSRFTASPTPSVSAPPTGTTAATKRDPWAAFTDAELERVGAGREIVQRLRSATTSSAVLDDSAASVLGDDIALLLADIADRPDRYRPIFDRGDTPTLRDAEATDAELRIAVEEGLAQGDIAEISDEETLARLLSGDLQEWMVFLHPSQRDLVESAYNGPARVRGGPGTGKSVVALHRAVHLARTHPEERVLLATFVSTLPRLWESLLRRIGPDAARRIDVRWVHSIARSLRPEDSRKIANSSEKRRRTWAEKVIAGDLALVGAVGGDPERLLEEIDHVLSAAVVPASEGEDPHPLRNAHDYERLEPRFRRARTREECEAVWAAYTRYRSAIAREGFTDYGEILLEAHDLATPTYAGVVVDEAQDLSSVALRLLWRLDASPNHRGFMIVGDGQQSIYPGGFSLRSLGIDVRGRSRALSTNWRTTRRIQAAADAVLAGTTFDDLDDARAASTTRSASDAPLPLREGVPPELHELDCVGEETARTLALVQDRLTAGRRPGDLAVLLPTNTAVAQIVGALEAAGIAAASVKNFDPLNDSRVNVGTFHRAKGFEFIEVIVGGLGAGRWPHVSDGTRLEITSTERADRALFVAMTRARDHLMIVGTRPLPAVIRQLSPEYADWVGPQGANPGADEDVAARVSGTRVSQLNA